MSPASPWEGSTASQFQNRPPVGAGRLRTQSGVGGRENYRGVRCHPKDQQDEDANRAKRSLVLDEEEM